MDPPLFIYAVSFIVSFSYPVMCRSGNGEVVLALTEVIFVFQQLLTWLSIIHFFSLRKEGFLHIYKNSQIPSFFILYLLAVTFVMWVPLLHIKYIFFA